jgi:hypothetical protein
MVDEPLDSPDPVIEVQETVRASRQSHPEVVGGDDPVALRRQSQG